MEKNHEQEDKEMDMLANTHHRDNEAKQAAQNQLLQRQDQLTQRQNKLDADRDASRATLEAQVEHKKQKRTEELQVVMEVMRLLPAPEAALPPPLGTPSSLQAMTPASVSSRESSRASSRSASRGTSPTRDILSLGHRKMSPIDEDKVKSTASKLKSQLEALSPELLSSGTAGGTMSLYTASVKDIRHGTAKLSLAQDGLTGVEAIVQIGDCTVLLSYGIINHYTSHETGMFSKMLFGATKPTGDAIDELCNVDRIFGGGRILIAFCGDTAHWLQYKGKGSFEKIAELEMPNVFHVAIGETTATFLESRPSLKKGVGLQVRVCKLHSISAAAADSSPRDEGKPIPYSANNRTGGKMIMSKDNAYLFLEDNRKNWKLFEVPREGGTINARKVRMVGWVCAPQLFYISPVSVGIVSVGALTMPSFYKP